MRQCRDSPPLPLVAVALFATALILMVLSGGVPELLAVALAAMVLAYTCAATLDNRQLLAAVMMLVAAVVIRIWTTRNKVGGTLRSISCSC